MVRIVRLRPCWRRDSTDISRCRAYVIESLELQRLGREQVTLASGKPHLVGKYEATLGFGGTVHSVEVVEAGEPLVGMALRWE